MTAVLSETEIQNKLPVLPGWMYQEKQLTKTFVAKTFPRAIAFVTIIGTLAEVADHHPDIMIKYNKVSIHLSTHSTGGITQKDFDLAMQIEDAFIG